MPDQSHAPPAPSFEDRFWTSSDGLQLYYRDYPGSAERPPLLCLHGLTRNSRDFTQVAERYAGQFRVIAVDFRGRGRSEHDPVAARYLPPTYANDVLQLLRELGIEEAIFFGTSLGGLVTMIVAALEPQRIAATILNDVGPDLDRTGLERIGTYVGSDVSFADWDEAADYVAHLTGGLPARFSREDWVRIARQLSREEGGRIVLDYDRAIAEPFKMVPPDQPIDLWPLFLAVAAKPLLILRGEMSDLLPAEAADRMRDAANDAELVTVAGVGHAPWLDEPEVIEALDRFLGRWS